MVHDSLFDSAWLKWSQAMRHAEALEAQIKALRGDGQPQPGFSTRAKYQPKRHGFSVYVTQIGPIPVRMRLLLGDAANNFRGSLDHLAWALVCRGATPPATLTKDAQRGVYFPISDDRRQFKGELPIKLPGVRRADIAKVRAHQPYLHGVRSRPRHYLMLLKDINTGDKHRTVQPIWSQPVGAFVEVTDRRDCVAPTRTSRLRACPLEMGTEITLLHARKTGPNPHIEVETGVSAEACLNHLVSVETWLDEAKRSVARLLLQFSHPPPEIDD